MADLFAEVDAAMRQERVEKLWKEHGKTIVLALGLIILGTAIGSAWKHWNYSARVKQTDALIQLIDAKEFPGNIGAAELNMRGGLRGVALLSGAGALIDEKKPDEALALYERAAADTGIPDDLRHLAILMSVRLKSEKDGANADDLQKTLKPVANDKNSPWRFHAVLESAVLYAKSGDYAAAREQLEPIKEEKNLPPSVYGKAKALDHVYALKLSQQKSAQDKQKKDGDS